MDFVRLLRRNTEPPPQVALDPVQTAAAVLRSFTSLSLSVSKSLGSVTITPLERVYLDVLDLGVEDTPRKAVFEEHIIQIFSGDRENTRIILSGEGVVGYYYRLFDIFKYTERGFTAKAGTPEFGDAHEVLRSLVRDLDENPGNFTVEIAP